MKIRILLTPSGPQKRVLDGLFAGPASLREMIDVDKPAAATESDILKYIRKHQRDLYGSLGRKSWEYCEPFLLMDAKRYLEDRAADLKTDPIDGCSISADSNVYIPLSGLFLLKSRHANKVHEARETWKSDRLVYRSDFALVKKRDEYLCELWLERIQSSRPKPAPREANSVTRQRIASIAKLCELVSKMDLAESAAYARVDFDSLEGSAVQGGALELGKRR